MTTTIIDYPADWDSAITLASMTIINPSRLPPVQDLMHYSFPLHDSDYVVILDDLTSTASAKIVRAWLEDRPEYDPEIFVRLEIWQCGTATTRLIIGIVFAFANPLHADQFRQEWFRAFAGCAIH